MINSVLDNDLYKFSMAYMYMKQFPYAKGKFEFKDRNNTKYNSEFVKKLKLELYKLADLKLTKQEFEWACNNIKYIPKYFWEWLMNFRFNPDLLDISLDEEEHLNITAIGDIVDVSLWEIPILATISELYYKENGMLVRRDQVEDLLIPKIEVSNSYKILFSEFGTRRRFSFNVQDQVCKYLKEHALYCTGTSNLYFAMKYNMKPIGTQAHEIFSFCGAQFGPKHANYIVMEKWIDTYDGNLGIALTDTFTSKLFFNNFSMKHAKLFDGIRQDSGNPFKFIDMAIERYQQLGIDPASKTIVFSDSLTFDKANEIKNYCHNRIKCAFGIGTNLTNDTGHKPMNIVMKLVSCKMTSNTEWMNCVKLSDDDGKHMGNNDEVNLYIKELNI